MTLIISPIDPTPIYSRHCTTHHAGTFQVPSTFPEAVSIFVLTLQVTQLVNNTAGFETLLAFGRTL